MKANLDVTPHLQLDFDPSKFNVGDAAKAIEELLGKLGCTECGRLSVHIQALEDPDWLALDGIGSLRQVTQVQDRAILFGR
jgi:hypothetical protein